MAITNKAIIELYKAGQGLPLDYPLYTWAVWRNMGYRVRKGEKCKHRVQMWKMGTKKDDERRLILRNSMMKMRGLFRNFLIVLSGDRSGVKR